MWFAQVKNHNYTVRNGKRIDLEKQKNWQHGSFLVASSTTVKVETGYPHTLGVGL